MLRFVLLGLLSAEPRYGYELKAVFEAFLGGTWPLNIGQVYTALARLEREGLVECQVVPQDQAPDRKVFSLTPLGHEELGRWVEGTEEAPVRLRDEFFLRILVRSLTDSSGAVAVLRAQRRRHLEALRDLTRRRDDPALHPATALLVEAAVLRVEADLTWMDTCEDRLKEDGA